MIEYLKKLWVRVLKKQPEEQIAKVFLADKMGPFAKFYMDNKATLEFVQYAALHTIIDIRLAEKRPLSNEVVEALEEGLNFWGKKIFAGAYLENKPKEQINISEII